MSKGRPYPDDVQAEIKAAMAENREVARETALRLHEKRNPMKVMREFCLECMGGSSPQVARCTSVGCPLWPYRKGKNPFRQPVKAGARIGRPFPKKNSNKGEV